MTNIGDLYTDFRADEAVEANTVTSRSDDWFARQSIARKLAIIQGVQLALVGLVGAFAWYGLSRIETTLLSLSSAIEAQVSAEISVTKMLVFGGVILAFAVVGFGLRRVQQDISSGVTELKDAMVALSRGRLDVTVTGLDRADDFGEMARTIERFRLSAIELRRLQEDEVERAKSQAADQERALVEQQEMREAHHHALTEVADKFDKTIGEIVGGVAAAASELQATATAMAANADQSLRQSERVGEALAEASGGVTAAAAASEEFAISIGEISRQATSSAELARKASGAALDADKTISELTDSATEVGKVVELISHIAQRTNLLALNASIEAARGGEAGRGFAVVATEVKELATQTGKATEQVAQQIRAMQDTTGASVGALRDIASHIKQLEITSVSIAAAVDQQSNAGRDLAKSIDLAARGAEDVSSNIDQVHEASKATGAVAGQVLASATELERQATYLRMKAGEFISEVSKN